ncbi:MAG: hypothetical protein R2697_18200 [Ilumatobacteraceae bacterium]
MPVVDPGPAEVDAAVVHRPEQVRAEVLDVAIVIVVEHPEERR